MGTAYKTDTFFLLFPTHKPAKNKMAPTIIFIRHAEARHNATNKFPHTAIVDLDTYLDHEYKVVRKLTFTTGLQHT